MDLAIIGGTGFYTLSEKPDLVQVETPYGAVAITRAAFGGKEVVFLPRHGSGHSIPPHRVNYRANIAALKQLGVLSILASASVGSMSQAMPPGSLVVLTQFLDFTKARQSTFFDGEAGAVVHTDMTNPYCPRLREDLGGAAAALGEKLQPSGIYVCAEGPRFETAAEIEMYRRLGADLVGMTNVPEVVLAREAGMCYATVAAVTNWAAGISPEPLRHEEVSGFMSAQTPRLRALFARVVAGRRDAPCSCRAAAR